jgi:transposase
MNQSGMKAGQAELNRGSDSVERQVGHDAHEEDEELWDPESACMTCGGDGFEDGDSLMEEDPLWWEGVDFIPCRNCGGSGLRKDQTCF